MRIPRMMLPAIVGMTCFAFKLHAEVPERIVQWSGDGSRMIAAVGKDIFLYDAGGNLIKSVEVEDSLDQVSFSPDGINVAYSLANRETWIQNLDTGAKAMIVSEPNIWRVCRSMQWSSSGQYLTYLMVKLLLKEDTLEVVQEKIEIFHVKADGTGQKLLISYSP